MQRSYSQRTYVVEAFLHKKYDPIAQNVKYLTKWENYSVEESTWETVRNLKHLKSDLRNYDKAMSIRNT